MTSFQASSPSLCVGLSGKLLKQSPNVLRRGAYQPRFVTIKDGLLSWFSEGEKEHRGCIDLRETRVRVEIARDCATRFEVEPVGTVEIPKMWQGKSTFTGKAKDRHFYFDAANSEHDRESWIEAIQDQNFYYQEIAGLCPNLSSVDFHQTAITDAVVKELAQHCPNLKEIKLYDTSIGDHGLKEIAHGCPNLEFIVLSDCQGVTDVGIKELARGCTNLVNIGLIGTSVTDVGIQELATRCTSLQKIYLSSTAVTDVGIKEIASKCPHLKEIVVSQTSVTDEGIKEIARGCPQLERIDLVETGITNCEFACVKELLRNCSKLKGIGGFGKVDSDLRKRYGL